MGLSGGGRRGLQYIGETVGELRGDKVCGAWGIQGCGLGRTPKGRVSLKNGERGISIFGKRAHTHRLSFFTLAACPQTCPP